MKIAIIGDGVSSVEAALYFQNLGGSVTIFSENGLGHEVFKLEDELGHMPLRGSWEELTSESGRTMSSLGVSSDEVTLKSYLEKYLKPICNSLHSAAVVKKGRVLRVQKRFLGIKERIEDKSRLEDLFRIVFSVNPKEGVLAQLNENKEVFEKLGQDVLDSLSVAVEAFEDFDLVIDGRGNSESCSMGPGGGPALNELNLKDNTNIFYANDIFENIEKIKSFNSIGVVGDGELSSLTLLSLLEAIESDPKKELCIVTDSKVSFEKLESGQGLFDSALKVREFKKAQVDKWNKDCDQYQKDLHEWRNLEDYMRVKVKSPNEPIPQVTYLTSSNVTALDRLLDREGLFLTCEKAPFRKGAERIPEMKTLAVDCVLVANESTYDESITKSLLPINRNECIQDEVGFFTLGLKKNEASTFFQSVFSELKLIEQELMKYFSRAQS